MLENVTSTRLISFLTEILKISLTQSNNLYD